MDTGVGQNCDDQDPLDISEESMAAAQPNADEEANAQSAVLRITQNNWPAINSLKIHF